jgi:Adenylate cyclase associated (CAP) C terminal
MACVLLSDPDYCMPIYGPGAGGWTPLTLFYPQPTPNPKPSSHTPNTQLYLPETQLSCDVTTAKSSGVNIIVMPGTEDGLPVETAVPEQFVTRYKDGQWVTTPVSHSAA